MLSIVNKLEKKTIFNFYSPGVSTNRDEWVYDFDTDNLSRKIGFFIAQFNNEVDKHIEANSQSIPKIENLSIKWSDTLKNNLLGKKKLAFNPTQIIKLTYRPFVSLSYYSEKVLSDRLTANHAEIFAGPNKVICFTGPGSQKPFMVLGSKQIADLHFVGAGAGTVCLPLYRYRNNDIQIEAITDWALGRFQKHYGKGGRPSSPTKQITKEDIFHYVYAVLHHPAYRAKYEINLKREFPRIPFYQDFHQWAGWGKRLMELHLGYETIEPYPLERVEMNSEARVSKGRESDIRYSRPGTRLIARKEQGLIEVDTRTTLHGVPAEAWEYRLGTYSALEWILERYKEKKPKNPTIAEKFNTYRFADYKEQVIDLLMRVCTVSVETMKIVKEMT